MIFDIAEGKELTWSVELTLLKVQDRLWKRIKGVSTSHVQVESPVVLECS